MNGASAVGGHCALGVPRTAPALGESLVSVGADESSALAMTCLLGSSLWEQRPREGQQGQLSRDACAVSSLYPCPMTAQWPPEGGAFLPRASSWSACFLTLQLRKLRLGAAWSQGGLDRT